MTADSESGAGETLASEPKISSSVLRAGGSSSLICSTANESIDCTVSIRAGGSFESSGGIWGGSLATESAI